MKRLTLFVVPMSERDAQKSQICQNRLLSLSQLGLQVITNKLFGHGQELFSLRFSILLGPMIVPKAMGRGYKGHRQEDGLLSRGNSNRGTGRIQTGHLGTWG